MSMTGKRRPAEALAKNPESPEAVGAALTKYNELVRAGAGLDFPAKAP